MKQTAVYRLTGPRDCNQQNRGFRFQHRYENFLLPLSSYFFKIHFKIIVSSTSRSSNQFLSFRFPQQKTLCISLLPHTCYRPYPSQYQSSDRQVQLYNTVTRLSLQTAQYFNPLPSSTCISESFPRHCLDKLSSLIKAETITKPIHPLCKALSPFPHPTPSPHPPIHSSGLQSGTRH